MNPSLNNMTGVILAGGKSLRYGRDKAFELFNGLPLIERVINVMQKVFNEVIIIANNPDKYSCLGLKIYEDIIKGIGPIAGILTGIIKMTGKAGFFVACDMPFLNPSLIRYMISIKNGFDIVVPRIGGNIEPLHAIYTKNCLPFIKKSISKNKLNIRSFFESLSIRYVEKNEIERYDPGLEFLININKQEDLRRFKVNV